MQFKFDLILNICQALFIIPLLYNLNQFIFKKLKKKHHFFNFKMMNTLFFYHMAFGGAYYIYALFNPSDSKKYYEWPQVPGKEWFDFFGTETTFINFISYPFINGLGFSYEMMMVLFAWVGFLGFVFAYLFFKENIPLKVRVFKKIDLLTLILFLPNMHFWTASLGKGAIIFFGLMLFAYSLNKPSIRIIGLIASSVLIFYTRPHIFLILAIVTLLGFLYGNRSLNVKKKLAVCGVMVGGLLLVQDQILAVVNMENSQNLLADFLAFTSHRSEALENAGSGVSMTDYSLPEKVFTFWFRPLFFDAFSFLGFIVSIENFLYLILFLKMFSRNFLNYLKAAHVNVKMSLIIFLSTSFAMTFVMSNLGLIIRQKTMIMYFLFFVIYHFLAHERLLKEKKPKTVIRSLSENLPKAA